jgi:hypothetical protein
VTHAVAGQLTTEDSAAVQQIFSAAGAPLDDQPGSDINAAVATLQVLTTFGA